MKLKHEKRQSDDFTSLGRILLEWGVVTPEELNKALAEQETLRGDALLGRLLVAHGACSDDDVRAAMTAQCGLRAAKDHGAMAVADIALARRRRKSMAARREDLIQKGEEVAKSITGDEYPVVARGMLAKPKNS